ncbi:MAG: T9SS type A sorting domain-containing protein [Ignavibacteria bacterium]|nr:T9SS type A sorting domain-containing protein [Ignavibacteria bacterium]
MERQIRKFAFVLSFLITQFPSNSQWMIISNQGNTAVHFPSENTGYSTDNGITRKTTNGGYNWSSITSGNLTGIFFINNFTGWIVGYPGSIIKTTNGGSNFFTQSSGVPDRLNDVFFINENTGWICGGDFTNEVILKTTNGGIKWISVPSGLPNKMFSIFFIDENTGWCVGGPSSPKIIKSINGGTNWIHQPTPASTPLYSVHFADHNTGWAVAGYIGGETIIKTSNGGTNWFLQTSNDNRYLRDCYVLNSMTAFAVGQSGKIIKTTNGGINWLIQPSGTTLELWSIDFVNDTVGYIIGTNIVLKTTNGGITFIKENFVQVPASFGIRYVSPNPFNPSTTIVFETPERSKLSMKIYDINGRLVRTLFENIFFDSGEHSYRFNGENLASGVYFITLESPETLTSSKMILTR